MPDHQWYYFSDDFLGNSEMIGPIAESEFAALARSGKLALTTKVSSPTRTPSAWHELRQVPGLLKLLQEGESERKQAKEAAAAEQARRKQAAGAARQARADEQVARIAEENARVAQFSHCQDVALVRSIEERVRAVLTSQETIQYIAVQEKPLVNIAPDGIVVTERRLIFYRPKLLGRFEFQDYLWFDLHNAHFKQNLLGATFWAQHVSGQTITMDYLPKGAAEFLYRIAQEREEQARLRRHNLQMETMRAGATNVNVQTNVPATQPAPTPVSAIAVASGDDLMKRLETLKSMLDKGLITPDDFERRKQEILAQL